MFQLKKKNNSPPVSIVQIKLISCKMNKDYNVVSSTLTLDEIPNYTINPSNVENVHHSNQKYVN